MCRGVICDLMYKVFSWICQHRLLHVWGVTCKSLFEPHCHCTLQSWHNEPQFRMAHNRQAIYMSLIPKVWVLARSPGSSELIFSDLLWKTGRDTNQNVLGWPKFLGEIWIVINMTAMAKVILKNTWELFMGIFKLCKLPWGQLAFQVCFDFLWWNADILLETVCLMMPWAF